MKTTYPAPVKNILDGITDADTARKTIGAVQTSDTDHPPCIYYDSSNDRIIIERHEDTDNRRLIQCDSSGVYMHNKVSGSWKTIPQAVSVGGTGATTAANARKNLGFSPTSFNLTAGSGITLASQYNFKYGDLVIVNFRWTASSAIGDNTTIATIPSGYRPTATVSAIAISPNNTGVAVAIGIGTDGKIYSGSGTVASRQYRVQAVFHV